MNSVSLTWLTAAGVVLLALLIVAALALLVWLAVGLFDARSLVRRELTAYFVTPVGYAVIVVFLAVFGFLYYDIQKKLTNNLATGLEWPIQSVFSDNMFWLVFLLIPALLTMRLFAEERATGTLEVLMTSPVREWQIVLSKFIACMCFYLFMWLPTLVYLPIILDLKMPQLHESWTTWSVLMLGGAALALAAVVAFLIRLGTAARLIGIGALVLGIVCLVTGAWQHYHVDEQQVVMITANIDPMPLLATYVGVVLAGAMFLSIGLLVSSLVRDQIVAAIITLPVSLPFVVAGFLKPNLSAGDFWDRLISFFSVPVHFSHDFCRGVVDTRHLVLYASVAFACLFITVRSLESRRWR
jgi:ABC-2 type transport system permease protein